MTQAFGSDIRQRTYIATPIQKVFDTITSAAGWDAFFTTGMELEPRPGGRCNFDWKDWGPDKYTLTAQGRVVEVKAQDFFSFEWYPTDRQNPTRVSFALEAVTNGTVVTLTESGYLDTPQVRTASWNVPPGGERL